MRCCCALFCCERRKRGRRCTTVENGVVDVLLLRAVEIRGDLLSVGLAAAVAVERGEKVRDAVTGRALNQRCVMRLLAGHRGRRDDRREQVAHARDSALSSVGTWIRSSSVRLGVGGFWRLPPALLLE